MPLPTNAHAADKLDTHQKALAINLDARRYGTFAEIGAGQEVVRWFFRVGGAAGTIAKSISAYDMTVSDAIASRISSCLVGIVVSPEFDVCAKRWDQAAHAASFCSMRAFRP